MRSTVRAASRRRLGWVTPGPEVGPWRSRRPAAAYLCAPRSCKGCTHPTNLVRAGHQLLRARYGELLPRAHQSLFSGAVAPLLTAFDCSCVHCVITRWWWTHAAMSAGGAPDQRSSLDLAPNERPVRATYNPAGACRCVALHCS